MPGRLEILRTAQALASHAAARQALAARNVAHADTPGYRPADLPAFSLHAGPGLPLRQTRPDHLPAAGAGPAARPVAETGAASPSGNAVSLEREMVRAAEIRGQHDLALSVFRASLDLMRAGLGRGR